MGKKAIEIVCDDRKKFVEKIVKSLEEGYDVWRANWKPVNLKPQNPISNVTYKGINRLKLAIISEENGYNDPRWVTFKQAFENEYKLKENQEPVVCEKWIWEKKVPVMDKESGKQLIDENGNKMFKIKKLDRPLCTFFKLYNAKQFENFPELDFSYPMENWKDDDIQKEILNIADDFINSSECPIHEINSETNCYIPSIDSIKVMPRKHFNSAEAFLGTLLHEMVHSTGHESRLNRVFKGGYGSRNYAIEELTAELATTFLEADLGINLDFDNKEHINYIGSWIECLKENPNILYDVCKNATIASEFLIENYNKELEIKRENELEEVI